MGAYTRRLPALLALLTFIDCGYAESVADAEWHEIDSEHRRGVALAREGRHAEALSVLIPLASKYPGHYLVRRDIVVITAWKGDCRATVWRHARLDDYPNPEPFYLLPVSECLLRLGYVNEAIALLDAGQRRWPDDAGLASAHTKALAIREAQYQNTLRIEARANDSDQGKREWLTSARLDRKLVDRAAVYARYASSHSDYDDLQTGKQDRLGAGLQYEFPFNLMLSQEFSGDLHRSGQSGSHSGLVYLPGDRWRFAASHTSFAEDLPLRAKAQMIEASRTELSARFYTGDNRWSWAVNAARYDFSDSNRRSAMYGSLGHAYRLGPRYEQRVFFEYYRSDNTLANAVYFNPSGDRSLSVVHKTSIIHATRFHRHVDHLYLGVGSYDQKGYDRHGTWNVRYEQDYDFSKRAALSVGIGHARRVYDGAAEFETSLNATWRWLF